MDPASPSPLSPEAFSSVSPSLSCPGVFFQLRYWPETGKSLIPYVSEEVRQVCRFSPAAVMKDPRILLDYIHPDDREGLLTGIKESARTLRPWKGEYRMQSGGLKFDWLEGRAAPEPMEDASILWHGVITCITERKKVEQEAKQRAQALEATADAVIITDAKGNITSVNPAFSEITGYLPQEVLGRNPNILKSGLHENWLYQEMWECLHSGQTWRGTIVNRRKNQSLYHASLTVSPIFDASGRCEGYIGVQQDVTEKRRQELALASQRSQLAAFIEHAPAAIAMLDHDLRYIAASRRWIADYGLEGREIIGHSHYEIFPNIPKRWKDIHQRCLEGEVERSECDAWTPADDQTTQYLRWEVRPWYDRGSHIGGIIMLTEDITAAQKAEQDLKVAKEHAEAANQAKGAFLATMSHEIRTPLNGVLGFAQLLESTPLTEEQLDYVKTIMTSGETLLGLINTILDFSKIEAGKVELDTVPYFLEALIQQVFETIAPQARSKDLTLGWYVAPEVPQALRGDPERVRQVLLNLVGNAVKFTPMGEVALQVEADLGPLGQPWVHFRIRDTGVGISADQQKRLFRPFTQIDATTTRKFGGTGLGLAITKRLARLMGGKVWIESEPGKGSIFHFTMVARPCPEEHHAVPLPPLQKLCLLAVDSLPESRLMLNRIASDCGCEAGVFSGWKEVHEAGWEAKPCDIALVDARLAQEIPENWLKTDPKTSKPPPALILIGHGKNALTDRPALTLERPLTAPHVAEILRQLVADTPRSTPSPAVPKTILSPEAAHLFVLVVEDNAVNQKLAAVCLRQLGVKYCLAANGKEALDLCARQKFDAILMDCQMPVMDGLEATRQLRALENVSGSPHLPIIAVTAAAFPEDREKAREAGMNFFLTKPFQIKDLAEALELAVPKNI